MNCDKIIVIISYYRPSDHPRGVFRQLVSAVHLISPVILVLMSTVQSIQYRDSKSQGTSWLAFVQLGQ